MLFVILVSVNAVFAQACSKFEVISARGTNEPQSNPRTSSQFISSIQSSIPNVSSYEVKYPATFGSITTGPGVAAADIIRRMNECPDSRVVLFGYSQGAMGVLQALNDESLPDRVVGVVLYGNPYWSAATAGETNAGTATTGSGTFGGRVTVPEKYKSRVRDYCNSGDLFCASGTSIAVHLGYPASPQGRESIEFAIGMLKKAG